MRRQMSAPISNSQQTVTAFTSSSAKFPSGYNGKIATEEFLEASKAVVSIIGKICY